MDTEKPQPIKGRPVFLTIICLFAFTYFLVLSIFLLSALIYSGWIAEVVSKYLPEETLSKTQVFLLLSSALILHGLAFAGTVFIWKLKKPGYFLVSIPCLIMASFQLFQPQFGITLTGLYILMILLFGLFYRRLG